VRVRVLAFNELPIPVVIATTRESDMRIDMVEGSERTDFTYFKLANITVARREPSVGPSLFFKQ